MSLGNVRLYGAGGFGINSVRPWDVAIEKALNSVAGQGNIGEIKVCYIDTSARANLTGDENPDNVYLVDGLDGAGKVRRTAYDKAEEENAGNKILLKMPPEAMNVVVFSASGGSGNIVGSMIVAELLKREQRVIAIVAASGENALAVKNSLDVAASLDTLARNIGAPIITAFEDNGDNSKRLEVDERVKAIIGSIAILAGPNIRELDSADVTNWLRYDKVPGVNVAPQLCLLDVITDGEMIREVEDPISIASIINSPSETLHGVVPDYSTVGYHPQDGVERSSFHYIISINAVPRLAAQLADTLKGINDRRLARKKQDAIVVPGSTTAGDGFQF